MKHHILILIVGCLAGVEVFGKPPTKLTGSPTDSLTISKMWYCCGPLIKVEDADTIRFNSLNEICNTTNQEYFVWEFESSGRIAYHWISGSDGVYVTLSEVWISEAGKIFIGKIEFEIITLTTHDLIICRVK